MNLEKHKKNPIHEWLEDEDSTVPTNSRSPKVLGSYLKIGKPVTRKSRSPVAKPPAAEGKSPELREPGPPVKLNERPSQAGSFEHLQKMARLPKMRAHFPHERPARRKA